MINHIIVLYSLDKPYYFSVSSHIIVVYLPDKPYKYNVSP